jgi:homoserine dehydrogenase
MHYKLALLGFGNVGRALAELLIRKRETLETDYGVTFSVTGIATGKHGSAVDPGGIDLHKAIDFARTGATISSLSLGEPVEGLEFVYTCGADVLFENTPVNYSTGQPALDYIRAALSAGMHVITANKGPVVHAYSDLISLAASKGVRFYFESAVMDGAPIFSLFRVALPAAHLRGFRGVLNSTTNLILSRMESGENFDDAVRYAQAIGIAETDPSGDVDGWDAAIKVAALVTVLMGEPLKPDQVDRIGIRMITPEHIRGAQRKGRRWKLVCSAERDGERVNARVAPEEVDPTSPLYTVDGTSSMVQFDSDVLGMLSIMEADPGPHTTAYGLLADFINAVKE